MLQPSPGASPLDDHHTTKRRPIITAYDTDVIIIGAGIAGLSCASSLIDKGYSIQLIEADTSVGGRVQTDTADGYLFDRGFQVLQLAYPAGKEMLDYDQLDMQKFPPGVRIRADGRFHILADPLRCPAYALQTAFSQIGTFTDRLKIARLAREVCTMPLAALLESKERLVMDFLVAYGFSERIITQFFKPFMTGVCLDPDVEVTDRFFRFVLRMFAQGDVGIPAGGMGAIPKQLARKIPDNYLMLNTRAESLDGTTVSLEGGEKIHGKAVVLATPAPETARLAGRKLLQKSSREMCLYYSTDQLPFDTGFLTLNGTGSGLINSVNFPSMVAQSYAPPGKHLISAVVPAYPIDAATAIENNVRKELKEWFGNQVDEWKLLRHYTIPHALPQPKPPSPNPFSVAPHLGKMIFDCSEYSTMPSIQWALLAGRRGAEAVDEVMKNDNA